MQTIKTNCCLLNLSNLFTFSVNDPEEFEKENTYVWNYYNERWHGNASRYNQLPPVLIEAKPTTSLQKHLTIIITFQWPF